MRKEQEIIIPATKQRTRKVKTYVCDICGFETHAREKLTQCVLCKRDVCRYKINCSNYDHTGWGDNPDDYCAKCYQLKYKKYAEEFKNIEDEYERKNDELTNKIKIESLALS